MTYLPNLKTVLSDGNTLTQSLGAGETVSGTGELNHQPDVMVTVVADTDGTLYCDFGLDGITWDSTLTFFHDTDRINPPHILVKGYRYFRIRFTNTTSTESSIKIQTVYGELNKLTSPINATLSENFDALAVRPTDYKYEIAQGKRQGSTTINKWGYNTDIGTSTPEIIASFGGSFAASSNIITTAQTFTITYTNTLDGSTTTGARTLLVTYLDEDFLEQNAIHTLGSTGSEVTSFSGLGINRVVVLSNGGATINRGNIDFTATVAGTIQARIPAGHSVTQQCIFHVQVGHSFLLDYLNISCLRVTGGGGSSPVVTLRGYAYSRVTNTVYEILEKEVDTAVENNIEVKFSQPFYLTGRDVFYLTAQTTSNNTKVTARFSGVQIRVT